MAAAGFRRLWLVEKATRSTAMFGVTPRHVGTAIGGTLIRAEPVLAVGTGWLEPLAWHCATGLAERLPGAFQDQLVAFLARHREALLGGQVPLS